ncbi:MAG: hypothetical protein QM765_09450 [Myxococcales bacterium]
MPCASVCTEPGTPSMETLTPALLCVPSPPASCSSFTTPAMPPRATRSVMGVTATSLPPFSSVTLTL